MFGKVTVGDGGVEPTTTDDADDKEDNNTPLLRVTVILATLGAVLFARMRQEDGAVIGDELKSWLLQLRF